MLTKFFGKNRTFLEGLAAWKFALFSGFAFTLPYVTIAIFLGPEFPSLFGGLIGLTIVIPAARRGWFLPKTVWQFQEEEKWDEDWKGTLKTKPIGETGKVSVVRAWIPYVLVSLLLILTRLDTLPFQGMLQQVEISLGEPFSGGVGVDSTPLYLPATILIAVSLLSILIYRMPIRHYAAAVSAAFKTVATAAAALLCAVPMVQVFINSEVETNAFGTMPFQLALGAKSIFGSQWPLVSPIMGALGAFVAGSNTISNMMFSGFQYQTAALIGLTSTTTVALQAIGGAAGNMICVHNIVAASAAAGVVGKEGALIRRTLIPTAYYVLFAGALASVWFYGFGLNIGSVLLTLIIAGLIYAIYRGSQQEREKQGFGKSS
jgi:lactate permease